MESHVWELTHITFCMWTNFAWDGPLSNQRRESFRELADLFQ